MNDTVRVQVLESIDDLHCVALNLNFVEALPPLEQLVQTVVGAQFQKDVDVLDVFEEMHELCNVCVLHRPVNFDLTHQLLLGSAPLQRRL